MRRIKESVPAVESIHFIRFERDYWYNVFDMTGEDAVGKNERHIRKESSVRCSLRKGAIPFVPSRKTAGYI